MPGIDGKDEDDLGARILLLDELSESRRKILDSVDPGLKGEGAGLDGRGRSRSARIPAGDLLLVVAQHRRRAEEAQSPAAVGEAAAGAALGVEAVGGFNPLVEGLRELVARGVWVGVAAAPEGLDEVDGLTGGVEAPELALLLGQ